MGDVKAVLAYVCRNADSVRAELGVSPSRARWPRVRGSARDLLGGLFDALATGEAVEPYLDAIDGALREAGDALGLYGRIEPGARGNTRPAGVGVRPPLGDETVYLCPGEHCTRASWAEPGPVPQCALTGKPLREDRL